MNKLKKSFKWSAFLIFVFSVCFLPLFSFLYGKTNGESLRNGIFSLFYGFGLLYFYIYSKGFEGFEYDNAEHPFRFLLTFLLSLVCSMLFPLVDKNVWFFLSIGIALSLFSNAYLALYSVTGMILFSCILSGNDLITFCVYLLPTFIGILLFQNIDKSFKVSNSIFISVLVLGIVEVAGFVLLSNAKLSADQFIMPVVNIAINTLLLIFVLKFFNQNVANKYRNKFLELNDQEYKELLRLKETSKEEYFRSIHTAYLSERIALAIGCDVDVCKNLAYYHRIKKAFSLNEKECEKFTVDNGFPPKASRQLLEFLNKDTRIVTKEASVVFISDKFISSLMNIFSKDKNIDLDYTALVDALLDKNFVKESLSDSDLTQKDFKTIREIMLKETLYYDFLR